MFGLPLCMNHKHMEGSTCDGLLLLFLTKSNNLGQNVPLLINPRDGVIFPCPLKTAGCVDKLCQVMIVWNLNDMHYQYILLFKK